ncbi:MAG TPA: insulinase family protein, partial [Oceanipulchritudo sp.]|nr:insulinase family protein [Oceanipulchritudo sp.]
DGRVFMDPVAARDRFVPAIEAISLDEVESVFRAAWASDERLVYVSGNLESIVMTEFEEALDTEVEAPGKATRKPWAYGDFGTPSEVVESNYVKDLDIHQFVLGNGVRLNLKQTDYAANKIHVKASFGAGRLTVPIHQPGLDFLAMGVFTNGGLGEHSLDEIKALTAGRTVGASFSVDDGEFTMGGVTNEEDLLLQLQLMAAYLVDPGYRPEARRVFLRQLDALYSQLKHNPNGVMQDKVARFLAGGDHRFGFPERDVLEARTLKELATWLRDPLREGYLELSLVGDFSDQEGVLSAVRDTFGALPERRSQRRDFPAARQVDFPRGAGAQVFTYSSAIDRAMATVNWPTADQSDIYRTRRLSVLGSVFSDRMRIEIREKIGEAYSPYAFNSSSDTWEGYGVFRAVVGVDPAKADLIQEALLDIGTDLAREGITGDELVRAIEPVKASIRERRRTNGYWLNSVLLRSQGEPRRLDWARSFEGFWDTITVEEVEALARQFLQPEDALPIQIQPQS